MSVADPGNLAAGNLEGTLSDVIGPPTPPERRPDEPQIREPIRGLLAGGLVLLLTIEICAGMVFVFWGARPYSERLQAIKDLSAIFLGPTIALVGAATGFYFGRSAN
jgi:hypothetical protein